MPTNEQRRATAKRKLERQLERRAERERRRRLLTIIGSAVGAIVVIAAVVATVVVTNPTHYAVALRYEREGLERAAPVVVAKGVDFLAQKIKDVAGESGVVCHEDVALARALHARVRIGQEIPEELYGAVAAVLAHVYRLKGLAGASA